MPDHYAGDHQRIRRMATRTPREQRCAGCGDTITTVTLATDADLTPVTYDRHDRHSRLGDKVDGECVRPRLVSSSAPLPR